MEPRQTGAVDAENGSDHHVDRRQQLAHDLLDGEGFAIDLLDHRLARLVLNEQPAVDDRDMRHGAVSLLVDAGAHPRIAQELLRHAPGSRVAMERYAHVTATQQREAADLLERAVAGRQPAVEESSHRIGHRPRGPGRQESARVAQSGQPTRGKWLRR